MRRFILQQNIQRFEEQIESARDAGTRKRLERLLAEVRQELEYHSGIWAWTCPDLLIPDHLGALGEVMLDKIVDAHQADFGSLQVWDGDTRTLRLLSHSGFDRSTTKRFAVVGDGAGSVCEAAQARRIRIVVEDIETSTDFAALRGWAWEMGIRSIQTTPVIDRAGRFLGAFSTYFAEPRVFRNSDHAISDHYAQQLAALLRNFARP